MKKISTLSAFLVLMCLWANAQSWKWAKSYNCSPNVNWGNLAWCAALDKCGTNTGAPGPELYVAGTNLTDTLCLPPYTVINPDNITAPSWTAYPQCFIAKYDSTGTILWVLSSTRGMCSPLNVTTDKDGNLLLLGCSSTDTTAFGDTLIVNPHFDYSPVPGIEENSHFFVMKVTPNGQILWCNKGGGSIEGFGGSGKIGGIACDAAENIYVLMAFDDTVLRIEGHTFTNVLPDSGDIFLVKYDKYGNYKWARTWGGMGDDQGDRIRVGRNNKLYITGFFNSPSLTLGSTTLLQSGSLYSGLNYNMFLAELDTNGNVNWATTPNGNCRSMMLQLDTADNIYVSGSIKDTVMAFGPHSMTDRRIFRGSFITKYSNTGAALWANFIYPLTDASLFGYPTAAHGMTIDSCNNLWFVGQLMRDSIAMNGITIVSTPPPTTTYEGLLFAGLNPYGGLLQAYSYPGGGDDHAELVADYTGHIYLVSATTTPFKLGADTIYRHGAENMFVAKFDPGLGCVGTGCDGEGPVRSKAIEQEGVKLHPNPASDLLTVIATRKMAYLVIYDIMGRIVLETECSASSMVIDVSALRQGLYMIRADGMAPVKFLKE